MRRIADPAAPRGRVDTRTAEPGMLECKQVMAGGHAGTATVNHVTRCMSTELRLDFGTENRCWLEAAIRLKVFGKRPVVSARNMSGDGIDRLVLAAKTWRGARIQDQCASSFAQLIQLFIVYNFVCIEGEHHRR